MFGYGPGVFSGKKRKKGLAVYKYSKDVSWLKLLQYLILLSILSPVSAKNVAGIQITGGYGPAVATHGYFNSTTVVTIEIELSDPYDDGGAEDLTNTYIYLKMGTNNDDSQLAYHQYNVKQGSATILNSAGGTIDGRTDVSFTEDVLKRYEAYGWHVQHVEDGNTDIDSISPTLRNFANSCKK